MYLNYILITQSNVGKGNNWSSTLGMLGQFFLLIIVFIVILLLVYYSTKWLASSKLSIRKNSNVRIIESISVGYQSTIQLIKVGSKLFLIGVTKESVTFLTEIDEEINEDENKQNDFKVPFEKYLQEYFNKKKKHD